MEEIVFFWLYCNLKTITAEQYDT